MALFAFEVMIGVVVKIKDRLVNDRVKKITLKKKRSRGALRSLNFGTYMINYLLVDTSKKCSAGKSNSHIEDNVFNLNHR